MTEIGMALSNPLRGERVPGRVGPPLPGVEVRLVDEYGEPPRTGEAGEIQVRGPTVFPGYWNLSDETSRSFTPGGWFRTGDIASVNRRGSFRILGRSDQDILKTGGEKISALEIEDVLRSHPSVLDSAVVGIEDSEWGERVCAAVVPRRTYQIDTYELMEFARDHLAPYKVPKDILVVGKLPRNAMGKVIKQGVRELILIAEDRI